MMKRNKMMSQKVSFRELVQLPSTTYATFGLYRYPAKFIPHVVYYVLKNYADTSTKVFDPFGGCGTVGIASRIYGCDYELWDLNPLIETLHSISTMKPIEINKEDILNELKLFKGEFIPKWSRHKNWFPKEFLPFLYKMWGYYHSLNDKELKLVLTIPLLKTTRYFSYDDMQRQKLSKSSKSKKRVATLLESDWKKIYLQMLQQQLDKVVKGVNEYWTLNPKETKATVKGGVDSLKENLIEEKDILITSPPYLQSQEYIRQAKLDLFWLGYSEEKIKELGKLEFPYRKVEPIRIYSKTFSEYQAKLTEPHIRDIFNRYFWGVLGTLTRLQDKISSRMFLFVGDTSVRGLSIPIDRIFIEHLSHFDWKHETTLVDKIVSRRLFVYKINPASKLKDERTKFENLVILKRTQAAKAVFRVGLDNFRSN